MYTISHRRVCVFPEVLWADCMCCLYPEYMPPSLFAATLTLPACSSLYGSTPTENYMNMSTSVDSPFTLTVLSPYTLLSSIFSMYNLIYYLVSPLLPLTCFMSLTPHQSRGIRHRLWVGGSCGWSEVLVVQKQRFYQEPLRWWQPEKFQVSTKADVITVTWAENVIVYIGNTIITAEYLVELRRLLLLKCVFKLFCLYFNPLGEEGDFFLLSKNKLPPW